MSTQKFSPSACIFGHLCRKAVLNLYVNLYQKEKPDPCLQWARLQISERARCVEGRARAASPAPVCAESASCSHPHQWTRVIRLAPGTRIHLLTNMIWRPWVLSHIFYKLCCFVLKEKSLRHCYLRITAAFFHVILLHDKKLKILKWNQIPAHRGEEKKKERPMIKVKN